MSTLKKHILRGRRATRTRARLHGTAARPRLTVFRSAKHISAQVVDDDAGKTLASAHDTPSQAKGTPIERAAVLGKVLGERAVAAGVKTVVFDRGSYAYHGRVKALAQGAREAGLMF